MDGWLYVIPGVEIEWCVGFEGRAGALGKVCNDCELRLKCGVDEGGVLASQRGRGGDENGTVD